MSEVQQLKYALHAGSRPFRVALAVAAGSVCLAAALRLIFPFNLGMRAPYLTFFPAVMFAALYGGVWSGVLSTFLFALIVLYFQIAPFGPHFPSSVDELGLAIFVGNGVIVSLIAWKLHEANARAIVAEAEARYAAERESSAAALAEFNRDFRSFLEQTTDFVYYKDREGRLRFCSQTLADITGHASWRDMVGKHDRELFPADLARIYGEEEGTIFADGKPVLNRINPFYDVKGRQGYVQTSKWPLFDAQGSVVGTFGIGRDITESRRHQLKLTRVLREQQIILDTAPICITLVVGRRIVWVNHKAEELFQYCKEELEGESVRKLYPSREAYEQLSWDAYGTLSRGEIFETEMELVRRDGSTILVKYKGKAVDPSDLTQGTIWTVEDVTERRLTADRLFKLSEAVEQSPVSVVITDTTGAIEFVNPMFTTLTGYSREEVLGKNPRFLKSGESGAESYREMWETITSGNLWEGEFHNKKKNGDLFWEHVKISPLRNGAGVVTNFLALKQNITRQKIAEDLLRGSEERFRQLFDQSNDSILILERDTFRILDFNGETERVFGYEREELLGTDIFSLVVDPDLSFSEQVSIIDKNYWQIDQVSIRKKDRSPVLVSARFKQITLNADLVYYCSFRDITDRVRSEEETRAAQASLIQADKMASLGLLVSGIAHEINNPNNCILFNSEILARSWNSALPILEGFYRDNGDFKLGTFRFSETREVIPKLFAGLVDGAERIRSIVDMLKDFARQDNGETRAAFDLDKAITNAIAIVNHEIKRHCNHFYLEAGDIPPAQGNAQQIEQVLINLIMNALQSLPGSSCAIRVATALTGDGERIAITVTDEGKGMSAEVLRRLTDPFFTTRGESGGTGLGLSITASILRKNRGTISFTSAPGEGTTATVEIPVFTLRA